MPTKKKTPAKKKGVKKEEVINNIELKGLGAGFLRFTELFYKFVLDVLKMLLIFVQTILWSILLAAFIAFVVIISVFLMLSAVSLLMNSFGVKDSDSFQRYRELIIEEMIEEIEMNEDDIVSLTILGT